LFKTTWVVWQTITAESQSYQHARRIPIGFDFERSMNELNKKRELWRGQKKKQLTDGRNRRGMTGQVWG